MREKNVNIAGKMVCYGEGGKGNPVVLLHPVFTSWREFAPIVKKLKLKDKFWFIAPDFPGFGGSEKPNSENVIGTHVSFLERLFAYLRIEKATIAGFSLGATIGLIFTLRHPERVNKLFLQGVPYYYKDLNIPLWGKALFNLAKFFPFSRRFFKWAVRKQAFWSLLGWSDPNVQRAIRKIGKKQAAKNLQRISTEVLIKLADEFFHLDLRDELSKIIVPVLIVIGEKDKVTSPESARRLKEFLPKAELAIIRNVDHEVLVDNPEVIAKFLLDFLEKWR